MQRAYLQAEVKRELYVELPGEDEEEGMRARLQKAMYGTRDAAHNCEWAYRTARKEWGFCGREVVTVCDVPPQQGNHISCAWG
jgi:hypothetical protein